MTDWYILRDENSQPQGPFTLSEVEKMYQHGSIEKTTLVTSEELGEWKELWQVKELTEHVGFSPPTPYGGTGRGEQMPERISSFTWNWGACLLPLFWGLSHRHWWAAVILIPWVGQLAVIVLGLYYGADGHRIAWRSGRFESEKECIECQRKWLYWSIPASILLFAAYIGFLIFAFYATLASQPVYY